MKMSVINYRNLLARIIYISRKDLVVETTVKDGLVEYVALAKAPRMIPFLELKNILEKELQDD